MAQAATEPLLAALNEFQNALSADQKARLWAMNAAPDADAVLRFTAEIDRSNSRRRSRCVASRLHKSLESVQQFTTIVDTFVSSNPSIAALVWGTFKVTILAVSNFSSFFDKLSEWFMNLQTDCPRFSDYQRLFPDSPRLTRALCLFYASLVNFCTKALGVVSRAGIVQSIKSFWNPFEVEFKSFTTEIRRLNGEVEKEIHLAAAQAAENDQRLQAHERQAADSHRKLGASHFRKFLQLSTDDQEWKVKVQERESMALKQALLDKLSTYDFVASLKRERKKRYGSTDQWLSKTSEYNKWLQDKSSCFWLSGIVGSGKTVLTAAVIDEILCHQTCESYPIAFFFMHNSNAKSLEASSILRCLIRQSLTVDTLTINIEHQLKHCLEANSPDADELLSIMESLSQKSLIHFIVLDGLDELPKSERDIVFKVIKVLLTTGSNIKFFASSRQEIRREMEINFGQYHHRAMSCDEVQKDIKEYIELSIEEKLAKEELILGDQGLLPEITSTLLKGARGMFLWCYFQIEDICSQICDDDIRATIRSLPTDLPETYQRALQRITVGQKSKVAAQVFRFIAVAQRSLSVDELREAIAVRPLASSIEESHLVNDTRQLVLWCASLVVQDEEEDLLQFAHHSVKEFLVSKPDEITLTHFHFGLSEAKHELATTCLTYLNFEAFKGHLDTTFPPHALTTALTPASIVKTSISHSRSPTIYRSWLKIEKFLSSRSTQNPDIWRQLHYVKGGLHTGLVRNLQARHRFLAYASEYWLFHTASLIPEDEEIFGLWKSLVLAEDTVAARPWTAAQWSINNYVIGQYAVQNNHWALATLLRTEGNPLTVEQTASLMLSAAHDNETAVLHSMISADPSAKSALEFAACLAGGQLQEMFVRLLRAREYKNGRSKSLIRGESRNVVFVKSGKISEEKMHESSILVESSFHVAELMTDDYKSLRAAAWDGDLGILNIGLKPLLDPTTGEVSIKNLYFHTALHAAAQNGQLEALRQLLHCLPKSLRLQGFQINVLNSAARCGHLKAVRSFITIGFEVTFHYIDYATPLHHAAYSGHLEVVCELLGRDDFLNFTEIKLFMDKRSDSNGLTALHLAAEQGHLEIVKVLLAAGADPLLKADRGQGHCLAEDMALDRGHEEVWKVLKDSRF